MIKEKKKKTRDGESDYIISLVLFSAYHVRKKVSNKSNIVIKEKSNKGHPQSVRSHIPRRSKWDFPISVVRIFSLQNNDNVMGTMPKEWKLVVALGLMF